MTTTRTYDVTITVRDKKSLARKTAPFRIREKTRPWWWFFWW